MRSPMKSRQRRKCSKCGERKSASKFYGPESRCRWCKSCRRKASLKYRRENIEAIRKIQREWGARNPKKRRAREVRYLYGLTEVAYNNLLSAQGHRCAICRCAFKKTPCVDHSHKSGKVRGLLCCLCNLGLGHLERAGGWADLAQEYLKNH